MRRTFERTVPHAAERMLALVADVEAYPRYIPHCEHMEVKRDPDAPDTRFDARMRVRFGPITQSYTSRIVIDRATMTLSARAVDGPFSHLESLWRITPRGDAECHIRFEIDFKIANPLIRTVAEPAFAAKQEEIVDAFVSEAARRFS